MNVTALPGHVMLHGDWIVRQDVRRVEGFETQLIEAS